MAEPLRVGIAGLGTVGASVIQLLDRQGAALAARSGRAVKVTAVSARDKSRDRGVDVSGMTWFDDPVALAKSADIDQLRAKDGWVLWHGIWDGIFSSEGRGDVVWP